MNSSMVTIKLHNLSEAEYQRVLKILGREPNQVELGIFSVMWSEHCSYKSSKKFLRTFPTSGPHVIQGPGENAGVVDIGDGLAVVFKMESHNHPSFIEPYQGAATGVGGILRDVFTMGARPIANLNSLRFGAADHPMTPHLVGGVVSGIAGYGNCMGIPTVGGEVSFDECYNGNILVNAMTVGLVASDRIFKGCATGKGNPVFYVGSKTGRDGIHGATMASDSFQDDSNQKRPTVQVGDPFTEKRLMEACLELMEKDALVGIQDMGAAGLTSSSFEMASRGGSGMELDLDCIPLREEGMTPYEIMLSESQERMLLVCQQGREEEVYRAFSKWDLDVSEIGRVTDSGRVSGRFRDEEVFSLPVDPLAKEAPVYDRPRVAPSNLSGLQYLDWQSLTPPSDYQVALKRILSHPNVASKKWVYRQYDHQVMTNTVVLPGSDAAVIRIKGTYKGLSMTVNVNSRYCFLDPFSGGFQAVSESGRNLVCSGARPLAVTDCLNFGNPERPEIMWQFEQAVKGIASACRTFSIPVVSGNVSFYNETNGASIYPTPTVGMVGLVPDLSKVCDQYFKKDGDVILLLGETKEEIGGSEYLRIIHGLTKGLPPVVDKGAEERLWSCLLHCMDRFRPHLLHSCHDLSEGGLAVALAESCMGRKLLGAKITLSIDMRPDMALFGESQSRVILSVAEEGVSQVTQIIRDYGVPLAILGTVQRGAMTIDGPGQERLIHVNIRDLWRWWGGGFEEGIFKT